MDSLAQYFGDLYLINLPNRVDRLTSVELELRRVGWDVAINGIQIYPAQRFEEPAGFPSAGARGCFHSHLQCLRRAYQRGKSSVLILEDDVTFCKPFRRLCSAILQEAGNCEWDFLYLAHDGTTAPALANEEAFRLEPWKGEIFTTACYAVRGRILQRLIEHLERVASGAHGDQEFGPMPIDGAYNIFRRYNQDIQCWISNPQLAWQRPSRSDITPKALDSLVFLRPMTTVLRRWKHLVMTGLSKR